MVTSSHAACGRADVETRIKERKLGAGLRRPPSGGLAVNRVWLWGAILAGWISALLQAISGYDQRAGRRNDCRIRSEESFELGGDLAVAADGDEVDASERGAIA
jgi:hypothetical protein